MGLPFPPGFPTEYRGPVLAERISAERDFEAERQKLPSGSHYQAECERLWRELVVRIWIVFVRQAKKLGQTGSWAVERVDRESREFLRLLSSRTREELHRSGYQIREVIDDKSREILPDVYQEFRKSSPWREFEDVVLELANVPENRRAASREPDTHAKSGERGTGSTAHLNDEVMVGKTGTRTPRRRHGFQADMVRHQKIASVVDQYAPGWRTGSTSYRHEAVLKRICRGLDEAEIDIPPSWKAGRTPSLNGVRLKNWEDALDLGGNKLVADQIRTSLNQVRRSAPPSNNGAIDLGQSLR